MRAGVSILVAACLLAGCGDGEADGGPDTRPPRVVSTDPQDGATNVDAGAKIRIVFDEAIERGTINSDIFHLELGGAPRYGSVSYEMDQHEATLSMMVLEAGATYQAVLEAGVRDLAGNRTSEAYRWSFTVAP